MTLLGRVKEFFRIPAIVGPAAEKAPLAILARAAAEGSGGALLARRPRLRWTVVTDRGVGGRSEAAFELLPDPPADQRRQAEGPADASTSPPPAAAAAAATAGTADDERPLAVFSGRLSTMRPSADPTVKRTGYCGVKIEFPRPLKVEGYEGLELRVRTDGRNYVTNLGVTSFFPDELYQGYITGLPGGRWFTLQLPFRDMTLTRLGRMSHLQRDLDSAFTLESIGFLIADGKDGPFRLEIGGVSAIGKITGRPLDDEGEGKRSEGEAEAGGSS